MENRKRNIQIKFRVTEKERELIEKKMAQLPIHKIGAYMRKMAIDGYIIYTDLSPIKEYAKQLQAIGKNINQIAKRVNEKGSIYKDDIAALQVTADQIWYADCVGRNFVRLFKSDAAYFVYGKELLGDMTELSQASSVPSRRRYLISGYEGKNE